MILLDTPVILWLAMDQSKLSDTAETALEKYAGDLWVSPISALEIGKKVASGSLELPMSASQWFDYAWTFRLLGLTLVVGALLIWGWSLFSRKAGSGQVRASV